MSTNQPESQFPPQPPTIPPAKKPELHLSTGEATKVVWVAVAAALFGRVIGGISAQGTGIKVISVPLDVLFPIAALIAAGVAFATDKTASGERKVYLGLSAVALLFFWIYLLTWI